MKLQKDSVPTALVGPIIEKYLDDLGQHSSEFVACRAGFQFQTPLRVLSDESGVPINTIGQIIVQRRKSTRFDIVDRLFCAMDMNHIWYDDPVLNSIYMGLVLDPPVKITKLMKTCAAQGCNKQFNGAGRHSRRMFCSVICRKRAYRFAAKGLKLAI